MGNRRAGRSALQQAQTGKISKDNEKDNDIDSDNYRDKDSVNDKDKTVLTGQSALQLAQKGR